MRKDATREIRSLDDYRIRYAQTKADPALKAAHAAAPWVVTWDDHEVDNNYAGLMGENGMESEEQMRLRRAAAYQAWWEHQPVRVPRARSWADLNITRRLDWGALARLWILDTRQHRSDQACGDGNQLVPCGDWADPARTLLGADQERWLFEGLASPHRGWTVLANQIPVAPFDNAPGADRRVSMDQWSGYPAALDRLSRAIATHAPNRTIAITGDINQTGCTRSAAATRAPMRRSWRPSSSARASVRAAMDRTPAAAGTTGRAPRIRTRSGTTRGAATSSASSRPPKRAPTIAPCRS